MDITQFVSQEVLTLTMALFGLTGLRLVLGVYSALKDGTFVLSSVGAFIRSQVLGRVFPILTVAYFADASDQAALTATAAALGAAYVAETIGAIQEAVSAAAKVEVAEKTIRSLEVGNPVPQD